MSEDALWFLYTKTRKHSK